MMKKYFVLLLVIVSLFTLVGCKNSNDVDTNNLNQSETNKVVEEYTEIKFSDMYETKGNEKNVSKMLQNLDGKKVKLRGYPAVQSPLDESFVYLNNQPYVTCPFCTVGDITKLEVIPIFMADKSKIRYTEEVMMVYGTLEVEPKVDSEGYTTQFRIYADNVETSPATDADKEVQAYYMALSQAGMIADIQRLQMDIEYASNPEYMTYYGKTTREIVNGIINEYIGIDNQFKQNGNEDFSYVEYIKECPDIIKSCEPEAERLKSLNNELIELYNDQIKVLQKYEAIVYKYNGTELSDTDIENVYNEFVNINGENLDLYNRFTAWNNKLRE